MSSVTTLDSVPLFHLVAEHLYAIELSRAAQVSKALRAASDSDESWTVSYGVSKAWRKQMVDADKAGLALAIAEHRGAIHVLRWQVLALPSQNHIQMVEFRDAARIVHDARDQVKFLVNRLQLNIATLHRPP